MATRKPAKPKTSTELKIQLEEARKKLARECQARNFKNCDCSRRRRFDPGADF